MNYIAQNKTRLFEFVCFDFIIFTLFYCRYTSCIHCQTSNHTGWVSRTFCANIQFFIEKLFFSNRNFYLYHDQGFFYEIML